MLEIITSPISFFILLSLFFVGGIGSLFFLKNDKYANGWGSFFAIAGSLWGLIFSITAILTKSSLLFDLKTSVFSLFTLSFHIDLLSSFFVFVVSLIVLFCSIYGVGYIKHYYKKYNIGALGFFYNIFIASVILVVTSSNALFFLIFWEIMAVTSYFLIVYEKNDQDNVKAGFLYLVMTYIGTAFIILAFLLLFKYIGSFDFLVIKENIALVPAFIKNIIFVSAFIGFGLKAGIIPLHIWLPAAHPAAPSYVSAILSGVMIKTGIYMMVRLFLDILSPAPYWWGLVILVVGSISSLLGVLYALTEHDIKRLLAYHSIENIGIILLGLGSALTFYSLNLPALALLGLGAALFHTLNHAIFKALLFLSAGSVISQVHTRNMEEYGGLIKYMPQTAFFFLIGSIAISALPPFNGFFSEWLTYQALFQGINQMQFVTQWIFILAAGSLVFTGGLALACFVKAFAATFLARPRSEEVKHAKESPFSMRLGMGALALLTLLFGVFSGYVISLINTVSQSLSIFKNSASAVNISSNQSMTVSDGFSSISGMFIFLLLVVATFLVIFVFKKVINKTQKECKTNTWDCGTDLTPRAEITATGFSRSIILIFKGLLKPTIQNNIEYYDDQNRYLPKSRTITLSISNIYNTYFYQPIHIVINKLSVKAKTIQNGNIDLYITYIFVALMLALLVIL
ncbi:MAG: proton-conducting transporter membrane subunit [Patescibacteria group bacterium]|nr:proton-conducting transporter membrane subunit [Patescibacteria group bacterium]